MKKILAALALTAMLAACGNNSDDTTSSTTSAPSSGSAFARSQGAAAEEGADGSSARNRLRGIVTAVIKDTVMAQVDIQAGPFRIVSLMSREAADELDLQVGSVAVAVIKSTTVVVERADKGRSHS